MNDPASLHGPKRDAHIILREVQEIVKLDDADFALVADVLSVAYHVLENRMNQRRVA
jgi:hypothetical protein